MIDNTLDQMTLLFASNTDQSRSRFAKYKELHYGGNYDRDINWSSALHHLFKNVIHYDYQMSLINSGYFETQKEIINLVKKYNPDFVLIEMSMYEIGWNTLYQIRKLGSLVILNFSDDTIRFDNYGRWWIGYFDYCLTEDKIAQDKYLKNDARSLYVICGANREIYKKRESQEKYNVSFVGARIGNRVEFINEIINNGIPVNISGLGWNAFIPHKEMIEVFNSSKINLNFTGSYKDPNLKQIKARIFEITMCGGFLLTEYVDDLEKYFQIGKEIDCFHSKEEAVDKIKYYLKNEGIRKEIALAGWERAQKDHSWQDRLYEVFNKIMQENIEHKQTTKEGNASLKEIPLSIRKLPSAYHYYWAKARLLERQWSLFIEEVLLSLKYYKYSKSALILVFVSNFFFLTPPIRILLHKHIIGFINYFTKKIKHHRDLIAKFKLIF